MSEDNENDDDFTSQFGEKCDHLSKFNQECNSFKVLNLFESLSSTTNSLDLQIKINKYVSKKKSFFVVQCSG
jgi:hypothetical protein